MSHTYPTITLRADCWEAIRKQIDGRALSENEKDMVRIAHEAIGKQCQLQAAINPPKEIHG